MSQPDLDPFKTLNPQTVHVDAQVRKATLTRQWFLEKSRSHPIRTGNTLRTFVGGEEGFAAIAADIEAARASIELVCWGFDPGMALVRQGRSPRYPWAGGEPYGELLRRKAAQGVQVRLLVWYSPQGSAKQNSLVGYVDPAQYMVGGVINRTSDETLGIVQHTQRPPSHEASQRLDYCIRWWRQATAGQIEHLEVRCRDGVPTCVKASVASEADPPQASAGTHGGIVNERMLIEDNATHHQKPILIDYAHEDGSRAVGYPRVKAHAEPFTAPSDIALLSEEGVLPRNINLKTFEPHRDAAEFVCRQQAVSAPALTTDTQEMHEQAMAITSGDRWPNERDWPRAMKLWGQAKALGHWKAALMWLQIARTGAGVNSQKGQFRVEPQPPEVVVAGMEALMRQGIADAFFWMGEFHGSGYGVDFSADRAWAFYELAADLGSPLAQTRIATVLGFVDRDQEKPHVAQWANRPLMYSLLECAHAQGHGKASYELGLKLNVAAWDPAELQPPSTSPKEQFNRALQILHDGVKFGSEDAANYLFATFDDGDPLVRRFIDPTRARRYKTLADALWRNPDLRFPNLDKVLPLPPASLPQWDGQPDSLINAAKGVRITPRPPLTSAHQLPPGHRAHIPPGHQPSSLGGFAQRPAD